MQGAPLDATTDIGDLGGVALYRADGTSFFLSFNSEPDEYEGVVMRAPSGALTKIIGEGDLLEVRPNDFRQVDGFFAGFSEVGPAFGGLVIQLSFDDGSTGLFLIDGAPPEVPALPGYAYSVAAVAILAIGAAIRGQR